MRFFKLTSELPQNSQCQGVRRLRTPGLESKQPASQPAQLYKQFLKISLYFYYLSMFITCLSICLSFYLSISC